MPPARRIPIGGRLSPAGRAAGEATGSGRDGPHLLIAAYAILKTPGTVYHDLGPNYFDERDREAVVRREIRRWEALGYRVTLEPAAPTAS